MSDELIDNVTESDVSPLGTKILALFSWLSHTLNNNTEKANELISKIFDVPKEDVFDELEKLTKLGFLAEGKPH